MLKHLINIETALISNRTVFRRVREGEGAAFYKLFQDNHSRMKDYFAEIVARTNSKKDCELWIRYRLADWLNHKAYYFGIWEKDSAKLIGFISIINVDWNLPKGEIQFFIDSNHSRKGIMTEVLNELVDFAFQQLKMQKLSIKTGIEYYPPQRLARKCGFNREGDLRAEFKKSSGEIMDIMLFGLSFTTYEKY